MSSKTRKIAVFTYNRSRTDKKFSRLTRIYLVTVTHNKEVTHMHILSHTHMHTHADTQYTHTHAHTHTC